MDKAQFSIDPSGFMEKYLNMCIAAQESLDATIDILRAKNFRTLTVKTMNIDYFYY